jgi:hypothetical protein
VVNLIAPASSYFDGCLCAVVAADPLTRRIALYHGDTGFGWQVGDGAVRVAGQLGVEVSVSATLAEVAAGDMLLVAGRFADDACASQQHRDQAAPNPAIGARAPPPTDVPAPINDPTRHLLTPPLGGRCGA